MLHMALDLVSFYHIFKTDTDKVIQMLGKDLEKANKSSPSIKVLHTGSSVEGLYLHILKEDTSMLMPII